MSVSSLLSWMLCGLIVGLIARFLVPGRQNMGLLLTMVLGIVGAVVGGFLYSLIQGAPSEPFSLSGNAWQGWIVAILGAMLVLWVYVTPLPQAMVAVTPRVGRATCHENGGSTMLVLSRKSQEAVVVGGSVGFERMLKVTVLEINGGTGEAGLRGR